MKSKLTYWILGSVLALFLIIGGCSIGCTRIGPGYAGIKVNMLGSQKGPEDFPIQTGFMLYNRWTTEVHTFPTFMQNVIWTQDKNEGSPLNESISFNSKEGLVINADVGIAYSIEREKVPHLFVSLRQDIDSISHGYLRNRVRDAFTKYSTHYTVMEIMGGSNEKLRIDVKTYLEEQLGHIGIKIDTLSIVGEIRVDDRVKQAINATIEAKNRAIEAENKVAQTKAEAEQAVEKARGESEAIKLRAIAQAEANTTLTNSLSQQLLLYEAMRKWDGILPKVLSGDAATLFQMDLDTYKKSEE